ncbi:hypothetical protein [Pseudomonas fluorescens]|uniref:hypothetical protein n=1 Tax=Pseudomonas fluorescens TaxID=294 RepID=UPI00124309B5|nr:hypothetical protein [Pseudomonas fluorescens]
MGFGALTAVLALAYLAAFSFLMGSPIAAEYWLRGTALVKLNLANESAEPKILFVGGSSTLFSIDTAKISKDLGRPVFNMGLHAGLPLQYHFNFAKKALRPGDIAIVIPEYGYYQRDNTNTAWFINQVMAWDAEFYRSAGLGEKLTFVADTPVSQLYNALSAKILKARILEKIPHRVSVNEAEAMGVFRAGWIGVRDANFPERRVFQYYYNNLNDHGDMNNTVGSDFPASSDYGLTGNLHQSPEAWDAISEFKAYCDSNNIKLLFGFAPIMKSGVITDNIDIVKSNLSVLVSTAAMHGVSFVDDPSAVFFDPKYFFDTDSHLNIEGRAIRSSYLKEKLSGM